MKNGAIFFVIFYILLYGVMSQSKKMVGDNGKYYFEKSPEDKKTPGDFLVNAASQNLKVGNISNQNLGNFSAGSKRKAHVKGYGFHLRKKKQKRIYQVERLISPIKIDANWEKKEWEKINAVAIDNFMARLPTFKPSMSAKLMYDDKNLYAIFKVNDSAVRCAIREVNGPVWEDNTVELFFAPDTKHPFNYFNLEINCGGVPLMRYNSITEKDTVHMKLTVEDINTIEIAHSYTPLDHQEIAGPLMWTIEYKIPLSMLQKYSHITYPAKNVTWKANFYKIAHKSSDPHYTSWNLVEIPPDKFGMHLPEFFGVLKFK